MPVKERFYTIIDMTKYKTNLASGTENRTVSQNTMVDLASVYDGSYDSGDDQTDDNTDVVTAYMSGEESSSIDEFGSGQSINSGFYTGQPLTNGGMGFTELGLKGQNPDDIAQFLDTGQQTANHYLKLGITRNNETGFRVQRGGTEYLDFGHDRIMNTIKQGKVVIGQSKELYYKTGSAVGIGTPATGGGGGAGGGSEESSWGETRKNGGNGGDGGSVHDRILIYPFNVCDFGIHGYEKTGAGGLGGAGGTASQYNGNNGIDGEDSTPTTFGFHAENMFLYRHWATNSSEGGGKGGGGHTHYNSNGYHGANGTGDVLLDINGNEQLYAYTTSGIKENYFGSIGMGEGARAGGTGGVRVGKENGNPGEPGEGATMSIIHILGSSGLHRN